MIVQTAREEGHKNGKNEGRNETICFAIKGFITKTRLGDAVIADTLDVSVELVKTIREEIKAEKAKKTAKTKGEKS